MQNVLRSKERGKRLSAMVMAFVMVFFALASAGPAAWAVTQDDINQLKSQAATLSTQKNELQKKLDKLSSSKNAAVEQKQLLEQKINVLREQIALSEQSIQEYGEMITQKEQELAAAEAEEAKYYDEFCDRVRSMEERGNVSYWAVLFNATSFSDLLDQINAISEIMDYDNQVMDQLAEARQAVADAKAGLEESKAAEETAKAELEAQKADLVTEEANVDATIRQITSQSDTYEEQLHAAEADADSIADQIAQAEKTYQAQLAAQKAAEEAAAKKAAAEAAAKKAAAQQAAQQAAANSSASTSNTTTSNVTTNSGSYLWPLSGYTSVSSPFGYRNCPFHGRELHRGCDIPAPKGTPIRAAKSGVVIVATYNSSYGNYVTIAHSDGTRTLYAHQSQLAVSAGQTVSQGQTIGYVGSTGSSTGNHLHFEIWTSSSSSSVVNPVGRCYYG